MLTKIRISYKEITQSQPQLILRAYSEINTSNDNDINTPSISYSIASEVATREFDYSQSILDGININITSNVCGITIVYQNIELIRSYQIVVNKPNIIALIKNILLQCTNKKTLNAFIDMFDELLYICDENIIDETFTNHKNMSQFLFNKLFLLGLNDHTTAKNSVSYTFM